MAEATRRCLALQSTDLRSPTTRKPSQSRCNRLQTIHQTPAVKLQRRRRQHARAVAGVSPEIAEVVSNAVQNVSSVLATASPIAGPLQPAVSVLGSDIASAAALQPTLPGLLRLGGLYYAFLARPSPLVGILDFYLLDPVSKLFARSFRAADLTLRDRLGGGNFGQVYEGVENKSGERVKARALTDEEKKRRVVLKRVNLDNIEVRSDFLRAGTMAKGAGETGKAESYMCSRIARDAGARGVCAQYLGEFKADATDGGFTRGTQWLVWRFESDSTLGDALQGTLGRFPACLESVVLGNGAYGTMLEEKRDALIIKILMKQLLIALKRLHALGIVHRDVKPENVLITIQGELKVIDFGAAVDMCTGINFNPTTGMLDPRYSPPEELCMPKNFPRAPPPAVAALCAPLAWTIGRPDLFDMYSAGVLLMQMAVPELRSQAAQRTFNQELAARDFDLQEWRETKRYNFTQLERNKGAGWDLVSKLICRRNSINRGRLSAAGALRHRFFRPEF